MCYYKNSKVLTYEQSRPSQNWKFSNFDVSIKVHHMKTVLGLLLVPFNTPCIHTNTYYEKLEMGIKKLMLKE